MSKRFNLIKVEFDGHRNERTLVLFNSTKQQCEDYKKIHPCILSGDWFLTEPCRYDIGREWISVEDRLPIKKTDVFAHYKTVEVIVFDGETVFSCEFRAGNTIEFWSEFDDINVTHWMPLPDPPK